MVVCRSVCGCMQECGVLDRVCIVFGKCMNFCQESMLMLAGV